eukprot:4931957-Pleurochrysis_carterae.AAC.1
MQEVDARGMRACSASEGIVSTWPRNGLATSANSARPRMLYVNHSSLGRLSKMPKCITKMHSAVVF